MCEKDSLILEAGCSAGQVLCCYYEQKYDIANKILFYVT